MKCKSCSDLSKRKPKAEPQGLCYQWANQQVLQGKDVTVVHGIVTAPLSNPPHSYPHAWIEIGDLVQDWQTMVMGHGGNFTGKGYPKNVFYELFKPKVHRR